MKKKVGCTTTTAAANCSGCGDYYYYDGCCNNNDDDDDEEESSCNGGSTVSAESNDNAAATTSNTNNGLCTIENDEMDVIVDVLTALRILPRPSTKSSSCSRGDMEELVRKELDKGDIEIYQRGRLLVQVEIDYNRLVR